MTTISTTDTSREAGPVSQYRTTSVVVGLVCYAVAAAFTVPNAHDTGEIMTVLGLAAVVSVVMFGWIVPRGLAKGAPATGLTLSVLAALLVMPAFWSTLPLLFGVSGVMLGHASKDTAPKRGWAAVVLGGLAVLAYLTLYIVAGLIVGDL